MSRCYICDYHPTNPSEYHDGLQIRHYGRRPHMHYDKDIDQYICTDCFSNSGHTDESFYNMLPIIIVPANVQE